MSDTFSPPRENLYRAAFPGATLRAADDGSDPVMVGEFVVFNQWTEINSGWEGNFMERVAPGACAKTFRENRAGMRVLFQHGRDPVVGNKPLGPIADLRETDTGGAYEVPLLNARYVREDVLPGLEAGVYGASYRFQVVREDVNNKPKPSAYNPNGLPERTIKEMRVMEFGPVTFPAYAGASAGIRSMSDEFMFARFADSPEKLGRMLSFTRSVEKRMDVEDIDTLADMIALAVDYIDEQDEPGDESNIAPMQGVITTLVSLMNGEVAEPEPDDEPEDDEENSQDQDGAEDRADEIKDEGEASASAPGADRADAPSQDGAEDRFLTPSTSAAEDKPLFGMDKPSKPTWRL